jgi:hypothetical protein
MNKKEISGGTVHKLPPDLREMLLSKSKSLTAWEDITPLARNEWICWIESVKKEETRKHHLKRAVAELAEGKRRPCCWIGCIHRKDKAISPSVRGILSKKFGNKTVYNTIEYSKKIRNQQ